MTRRRLLHTTALVAAAGSLGVLAACGSGSPTTTPTPAPNQIQVEQAPGYYPADYSQVMAASKTEGGKLVIYSTIDEENWAPIFRDFKKKYPWVTDVTASSQDADAVFSELEAEQAGGKYSADLIVSNAAQAWAQYASVPGRVTKYSSPELSKLPAFAELMPGVYAMSADPMTLVHNTTLITDPPTGLNSLAAHVKAQPTTYHDKITTRSVNGSFGFTVSYAFVQHNPTAAWNALEVILPQAVVEVTSDAQLDKLASGDYAAGFFISAAPAYPMAIHTTVDGNAVLGITFPDDGTVVVPRGIGIGPKPPHPNTAKLFLDFVLSAEGQRAVAEGGLTSYREGISGPTLHTYQDVVAAVGADNIIIPQYKEVPQPEVDAFVDRWNSLLAK